MRFLSLTILLALSSPVLPSLAAPGDVNLVNCSIFDQQGQLVKKYVGWVCAFFPNGKMLVGDGFTLDFYDENMNLMWGKDMHIHNNMIYSEADQTALAIASIILPGDMRSERLEVYNKEGQLIKHFNFNSIYQVGKFTFNYDRHVLPSYVTEEITHVESFHRIPRNKSKNPVFKEGNYIASDSVGLIFILDSKLQKVIHKVNTRPWGYNDLRDVQVTKDGNFLFYNAGNRDKNGKAYNSLDEINAETGKSVWRYTSKVPTDFYAPFEGNLQILPNNNVLFSMVLDERKGAERVEVEPHDFEPWMTIQGNHQAVEITRDGKEVWRMVSKDQDISGKPNVVKRYNLSEYLKKKKKY